LLYRDQVGSTAIAAQLAVSMDEAYPDFEHIGEAFRGIDLPPHDPHLKQKPLFVDDFMVGRDRIESRHKDFQSLPTG
jgi:hypothetical protein